MDTAVVAGADQWVKAEEPGPAFQDSLLPLRVEGAQHDLIAVEPPEGELPGKCPFLLLVLSDVGETEDLVPVPCVEEEDFADRNEEAAQDSSSRKIDTPRVGKGPIGILRFFRLLQELFRLPDEGAVGEEKDFRAFSIFFSDIFRPGVTDAVPLQNRKDLLRLRAVEFNLAHF